MNYSPTIAALLLFTVTAYSAPTNEEVYAAVPTDLSEGITLDGMLDFTMDVTEWRILFFENEAGIRSIGWVTSISVYYAHGSQGHRYGYPLTDSGILTTYPRIPGPNFDAATKPADLEGGEWEFRWDRNLGNALWTWRESPVTSDSAAGDSTDVIYRSLKLNRQIDQSVRRKMDRKARGLLRKQRVVLARGADALR